MDGRRAQKVIDMLPMPEFDSEEVNSDLHKRMNKAIEDGRIKFFNMLESNLNGDQDLSFWTREMVDIVREIMEDMQPQPTVLSPSVVLLQGGTLPHAGNHAQHPPCTGFARNYRV